MELSSKVCPLLEEVVLLWSWYQSFAPPSRGGSVILKAEFRLLPPSPPTRQRLFCYVAELRVLADTTDRLFCSDIWLPSRCCSAMVLPSEFWPLIKYFSALWLGSVMQTNLCCCDFYCLVFIWDNYALFGILAKSCPCIHALY